MGLRALPGGGAVAHDLGGGSGTGADGHEGIVDPAQVAVYAASDLFDRPGFSTLKVEGAIIFFVAGRDSVVAGNTRTYRQMRGQNDLTND